MNTISRHLVLALGGTLCSLWLNPPAASAQTLGLWDFNQSNLVASAGSTLGGLQYVGGAGSLTEAGTVFGTTAGFGLPPINGTNAVVMQFPASTDGMGYYLPTPPANGRGSFVDNYTLILDVLFPAESEGKIRPVLETDGDLIVPGADLGVGSANGIGLLGGTLNGLITTNTWYRLGFVVRTNELRSYINGSEVGVTPLSAAQSDRLVLSANATALLLANTGANPAAGGYLNSLQIRDEALEGRKLQALGGPSAAGIPLVVPSVPSFVVKWTPAGTVASRTTDLGVVLDEGDTAITDSSLVLKLDGTALGAPGLTRAGSLLSVKTNLGLISLGSHVVSVTYSDNTLGLQTYSNTFVAVLFYEDFDSLPLGTNVNEGTPKVYENVWTKTPPAGWVVDDSGMPGVGNDAADGMTEWAGWGFASKSFWGVVTDDQGRQQFTNAKNTVAVADPDEWDDRDHAMGYFNSFLKTPPISLAGVSANTVFLKFDSSWDFEAFDDCGGTKWPACPATNNQTATIFASFNGGAPVQVLKWDSNNGQAGGPTPGVPSPTFHTTTYNESVTVLLNNPAGATNVVLTFGLTQAGNDWWWAVDNIQVASGPAITTQPASLVREAGTSATFSVVATGGTPLNFQWQYNGGSGTVFTNVAGANLPAYTFIAETNNAGAYRVVVNDPIGSTISAQATLAVIAAPLFTQQPVSQTVNPGVDLAFSVGARGRAPLTYQWTKGGTPISGATGATLAVLNAQPGDAGVYRCLVSNPDATVTSMAATLKVVASISEDLVVHLPFDNSYADTSGRGNHATAVGAPAFVSGKIGAGAMQFTTARDGSSFNYATLGYPADLHFSNDVPFSVAFWFKLGAADRAGDPALVGTKNWNSGNNNGFVIFTTGPLRWSYRELDVTDADPLRSQLNARKDSGTPSSNIQDGNWHHCVVTFNRGGNAGSYVDGQLIHIGALPTANSVLGGVYAPTTIDTDPTNSRTAGSVAINIGQDGAGSYTDGGSVGITNAVIDDLGIWRRTLTPGEVAAIYAAGLQGKSLEQAAPVSHPRPLDPTIALTPAGVAVTKGNTALFSAPDWSGPWSEVTGARGTNVFTERPVGQKYYRGSQP